MELHPRFGIAGLFVGVVSFVALCFGPLFAASTEAPPTRADATPILEPSTLLLVGIGLVGIAIFRSRSRDPNADPK